MIPALIIWLFKKYGAKAYADQLEHSLVGLIKQYIIAPPFLLFLLFCPANTHAQETTVNYSVWHNGNVIGKMQFNQKVNGEDVFLKMTSTVKTRFIFSINVITEDQAHFKAGKLMYSDVYRKVNGKEKESKRTQWGSNNYQLKSGKNNAALNNEIRYNMMLMYTQEPTHTTSVYSDNFQKFLNIKKTGEHTYRIDLPDGNYNEYYFQKGMCNLVVIHHSLYTIEMKMA